MKQSLRSTLVALVLLGCWPSLCSAATRDHVQTSYFARNSGSSFVYASNNTAGNTLVVYCANNTGDTSTPTISDSLGNTYVLADSHIGAGNRADFVWIVTNCAAGLNTVTITLSGQTFEIIISEYEGAHQVDQVASANAPAANPSSGATASTTQADELVLGFASSFGGASTAGSGYTLRGTGASSFFVESESKVVSSTGAQTATFVNASTAQYNCICVTLKAEGSGSSVIPLLQLMQLIH